MMKSWVASMTIAKEKKRLMMNHCILSAINSSIYSFFMWSRKAIWERESGDKFYNEANNKQKITIHQNDQIARCVLIYFFNLSHKKIFNRKIIIYWWPPWGGWEENAWKILFSLVGSEETLISTHKTKTQNWAIKFGFELP